MQREERSSPLPVGRLVLPSTDAQFQSLRERFVFGSSSARVLEVYDTSNEKETLRSFRASVEKLERALRDASALSKEHGSTLSALNKARLVAHLQERHWWHGQHRDRVSEGEYLAHKGRLVALDTSLEKLGERLVETIRETHEAKHAGLAVLKKLSDTSAPEGGIPGLIEVLATARWNIPAKQRGELVDLLRRGVAALSISPVAEKFIAEHGLDLLESHCNTDPKAYRGILAELGDEWLINELDTNWKGTIDDLRSHFNAERFGSSPLSWAGKVSKQIRSALSLAKAALTPTTLGLLLTGLRRVSKDSTSVVGRRLSAFMMRSLTTTSFLHFESRRPLTLQKYDMLKMLTEAENEWLVVRLTDEAAELSGRDLVRYWRKAGEELSERQMNKYVTRKPGFYGSMVAVNMIILCATLASDEDDPLVYGLALAGGILGTAQALVGATPFLSAPRAMPLATDLSRADAAANWLGRSVAVIGMVTSVAVLSNHYGSEPTRVLVVDWMNVASGALTASAWLAEFGGALSLASGLGVAAAAVGFAAIAASIIVELSTPGPLAVIKNYISHIEDDEQGSRLPIEIADVKKHLLTLDEDGTFHSFEMIDGRPRIDPYKTSPTLYGTWQLGFSHLEISKLFSGGVGRDLAYVKGVLPSEKKLSS